MKKTCLFFLCSLALHYSLPAQDIAIREATNTDIMRTEGKIYVVLAVILTILAGLIFYLVRLDRKIIRIKNLDQ